MRTGRPVLKRNARTLARDIASLKRLRKAIRLDNALDSGRVQRAVIAITDAITALSELGPPSA